MKKLYNLLILEWKMAISTTLFYQLISAILTAVLAFTAIVQTFNSLKFGLYARMDPKLDKDGDSYMIPIIGNTGPGLVKNISWTLSAYSPEEGDFDMVYGDAGKIAFIPPQTTIELDSGLPRYIIPFESKVNLGNPYFEHKIEEYRSFKLTLDRKSFFILVVSSEFKFNADGRLSRYKRKVLLGKRAKNKKKVPVRKKRKELQSQKDKLI